MGAALTRVFSQQARQRGFTEEQIGETGGNVQSLFNLLQTTPPPPRAAGIEARTPGEARERQRRRTALLTRGGGRAGTILTSPLGLTGEPSTARRTLLGG